VSERARDGLARRGACKRSVDHSERGERERASRAVVSRPRRTIGEQISRRAHVAPPVVARIYKER
jgi:hypothetical protein